MKETIRKAEMVRRKKHKNVLLAIDCWLTATFRAETAALSELVPL
jgi:hypothetical protein